MKYRIRKFLTEFKGWKGIILVIGVLVFALSLYFSWSLTVNNPWASNIFLGSGVTVIFGIVLSVVFSYITENAARTKEMKREIFSLLERIVDAKSKITLARINKNASQKEKLLLVADALMVPRLYTIQEYYPKFAEKYYSFTETITKKTIIIEENNARIDYEKCLDILQMLYEEVSVLYKLYCQEYGYGKKEPIEHSSNKDIEDAGILYSQRKRMFKKGE